LSCENFLAVNEAYTYYFIYKYVWTVQEQGRQEREKEDRSRLEAIQQEQIREDNLTLGEY
jgi:hypothetical protein